MSRMKHILFAAGSLALSMLAVSCHKDSGTPDDQEGNWVIRSEFDGIVRSRAVSFVVNDTAYVGTGYNRNTYASQYNFYKYVLTDQTDYWTQIADFPGTARNSAVGFNIGSKGYVGTGSDGVNMLKDFWEYNPATGKWTRKADFGGTARIDATGFGIGSLGYITTGFDNNYLKDMWQYDPVADKWTSIISLGGAKRAGAVSFVYNNKAYIVTGYNNGSPVNDFFVFDPSNTNQPWTELRKITNVDANSTIDDDYTDIQRQYGVAFVIGTKAYLSTGDNNGSITSKTWCYDFASDSWTRRTSYERSGRTGAVGFAVKGRGFVGTGKSGSLDFDNFDEFIPTQTYNAND